MKLVLGEKEKLFSGSSLYKQKVSNGLKIPHRKG